MNGYLSVDDIEQTLGDYFLLDRPLWADFWKPIRVEFVDDSDGRNIVTPPDITVWATSNNLICNEKAYSTLKGELSSYGEWLPLTCENIEYWLLHTTKKTGIDLIDTKESQRTIDVTGYTEAQKITLKPRADKNALIFQTEYTNYQNVFCSGAFKSIVEDAGLNGLRFSEDMSNAPF